MGEDPKRLRETMEEVAAELAERMDAVDEHHRDLIAEHGWSLQTVLGDEHSYGFTYTVGLTAKGLPELLLDTLAPRQAGPVLNACADHMVEHGPLEVPDPSVLLRLPDWSVPFRLHGPIDPQAAEAFLALRFAEDPGEVRLLQVLWPDEEGRYPGDDGYDVETFPQRLMPVA
jgi:hypothetical protein